jgi:hypothetical protein
LVGAVPANKSEGKIMKRFTEDELKLQEQMDKDVYESTRSMFEHFVLRVIREAKHGGDVAKDVDAIINLYNGTSESAQRLMGKVRRLDNEVSK